MSEDSPSKDLSSLGTWNMVTEEYPQAGVSSSDEVGSAVGYVAFSHRSYSVQLLSGRFT